MKKLALWRQC